LIFRIFVIIVKIINANILFFVLNRLYLHRITKKKTSF